MHRWAGARAREGARTHARMRAPPAPPLGLAHPRTIARPLPFQRARGRSCPPTRRSSGPSCDDFPSSSSGERLEVEGHIAGLVQARGCSQACMHTGVEAGRGSAQEQRVHAASAAASSQPRSENRGEQGDPSWQQMLARPARPGAACTGRAAATPPSPAAPALPAPPAGGRPPSPSS